jgi:lipoprotein LpqH
MRPRPSTLHARSIAVAVVLIIGVASCSSPPSATLPAGAIPTGAAKVTLGDQDGHQTSDLACQTNESITIITIDTAPGAITAVVDNAKALTAKGVTFDDVGGFSGSYWSGLQGSAAARMVDQTYTITGIARGFNTNHPAARIAQKFTILAAC